MSSPARLSKGVLNADGLAAVRDGRLKLHKAKENTNGTFSIGKTWGLEELRQVEVARVRPWALLEAQWIVG